MIHPVHSGERYAKFLPLMLAGGLWTMVCAFFVDTPQEIWQGLRAICLSESTLITDYLHIAGVGATLINCGLVCLISTALIWLSRDPVNGFTLVDMGLMAGFSFFGKNFLNILPIIAGTWLYARFKREPFSKYVSVALLSTSLAPVVSFLTLAHTQPWMPLVGLLTGLLIGFCVPPLAAYTFRIQNGMNLYNAGFACGILSMVLVPIMTAMGLEQETVLFWSDHRNLHVGIALTVLCLLLITAGLLRGGKTALKQYWRLLHTSGRLPSDYLRAFGSSCVAINMGCNGLLGMGYILLVGGDLNGPTVGAILTIMGFSAYGKHPFNIAPVMLGVFIGNFVNHVPLDSPSMQLAGLFGTTLAPFSGLFGWPVGILAGLLHSSVVLQSGSAAIGMNLYNNGFSGGIIAIVLYPILTAILHRRRPNLADEVYYDMFEHDEPISPKELEDTGFDGSR